MTSSGWTSARPLTGAIEIRVTTAMTRSVDQVRPAAPVSRPRLHGHVARTELEDVKVAPGHVHRDEGHGHRPDRAFEASRVRVAVQHDVGPVLGKRPRESVAAEIRPELPRLAGKGAR